MQRAGRCPWAGGGKGESWSIFKWPRAHLSSCGASALVHHVVKFVRNLGGGRSLVFLAGKSNCRGACEKKK